MNHLKSICHSINTLLMQLLTWLTSRLVMGSLGGGPACVRVRYCNKGQLLESYSCIQFNWENMGNWFLSRLFFSPLKVPTFQNTSPLVMKLSLYVHMSYIKYNVLVAIGIEIPNIIVYPAWPWHCNESSYVEIPCPIPSYSLHCNRTCPSSDRCPQSSSE